MKKYENPTIEIVNIAIDEIMLASVGTIKLSDLGEKFGWELDN